ncbi:alpha/beta fold hydrolase [Marinobacterium sp. LSUCC0821]|jgi:pimeloyl-ACP methyl ester carboxylesterase|uniref:alpha/beta fold hydrolase n=1 Tax=Marinobacterium sp. LSUCC0821 TaxID=2668067 RepID=UPI00145224A4|nr:alpha/beta hydrolase [Marinobacterium sp. LSUCC0821]QJD71758.1 alpha/beta hydrolase [Marinobacterium sp. LSUCC0821]
MSWKQVVLSETPEQRALRDGLGIREDLKRREVWRYDAAVNVEIYRCSDDAPNLLFLAGIGTYVELYAELAVKLVEQGFNVIAVDPPGHGYSAGDKGRYSVEQFRHQLTHVIDRVSDRFIGDWSVFGYSIGSLHAVSLAEHDPRIKKVVCDTLLLTEVPPDFMHALGWSWTSFGALWFPASRVPLKSFIDWESLLGDHPAGPYINQDPKIIFDYPLGTLSSLFTHRAGIATHSYPFELTILQGDQDEVLSLEYAYRVANYVKQPIHVEVIPGAGHMLPWDDPALLANKVAVVLR